MQDRSIEKPELVDALTGMFAIEREALTLWIDEKWKDWDFDMNGRLGKLCGMRNFNDMRHGLVTEAGRWACNQHERRRGGG